MLAACPSLPDVYLCRSVIVDRASYKLHHTETTYNWMYLNLNKYNEVQAIHYEMDNFNRFQITTVILVLFYSTI